MFGMEFKRADRVADLVQQVIADLLLRRVKDPRVSRVTVTGVKVSSDLQHARVYYCVMSSTSTIDRTEVSVGLNKARGFIRQELAKRLHTRVTPQLTFEYDTSFDYGDRIERLIKELHKDE